MRYLRFLLCVGAFAPILSFAQNLETVSGTITQNTTWTANKTWLLEGKVYVKNGATLTIQPGTVVKGDKASKGTLIITRGSKIIADGLPTKPVVFTSNETNPAPGDWGGVVVLGYAPTNTSANGMTCLGVAEGNINNATNDARYGSGDQPGGCGRTDDNSGILRYVRIEYGGISYQLNNETNGLTLAGVGSGTTVDYVQVSHSGDDGFEFFGGTVNCKHLVSYGNKDDDFDFDLGYQGHVQFALGVRNPDLSDVSGSNGLEVDNDNSGTPYIPKTRPTLSNFTLIGPTGVMDDNFRRAAHLRRNAEPALYNSLFIGNFPVGLCLDGVGTIANAQTNLLEVKNTYLADAPELLKSTEATFNINQWFGTQLWENEAMSNSQSLALQAPFNVADPNAQPLSSSVLNNSASFTAVRANVPFFEKVSWLGAFNTTDDWTCGWAKFEELNTNCTMTVGEDTPVALDQEVAIAPNVTANTVMLSVNLLQKTECTVEIFNLNGQSVGVLLQETVGTGVFERPLSVAHLSAGMYTVSVRLGQAVFVRKLVKM